MNIEQRSSIYLPAALRYCGWILLFSWLQISGADKPLTQSIQQTADTSTTLADVSIEILPLQLPDAPADEHPPDKHNGSAGSSLPATGVDISLAISPSVTAPVAGIAYRCRMHPPIRGATADSLPS